MSGVDRVGVCCCIQVIIFQGEMEIACRIDHFFITNKQIKNKTKQKKETVLSLNINNISTMV